MSLRVRDKPLNTGSQTCMPVRYGNAIGLFDQAFIEEGVMRPAGRSGIVDTGDWAYSAAAANELVDGKGEVVPADLAFVAIIIYARDEMGSVDNMKDCGSQVSSVSGGADLVVDDIYGGPFGHKPDHGFDEVVAELGIDP